MCPISSHVHCPYITVIITAYGRRQYLQEALRSVQRQTLSRDMFETVLVSNFEAELSEFSDIHIRNIHMDEKRLGPKINAAIMNAKGEILCFLDDDDLWEESKLQHVYGLFSSNPALGYYHNGYSVVDETGNSVQDMRLLTAQRRMENAGNFTASTSSMTYSDARSAVYLGLDFNSSSISVRRSLLTDHLRCLEELELAADSFYFYASLAGECEIWAEDRKLTRYRTHPYNITSVSHGYLAQAANFSPLELMDKQRLLGCIPFHNSNIRNAIECGILDTKSNFLRLTKSPRSDIARTSLDYLRYSSRGFLMHDLTVLLFNGLYILLPEISNKFVSGLYRSLGWT